MSIYFSNTNECIKRNCTLPTNKNKHKTCLRTMLNSLTPMLLRNFSLFSIFPFCALQKPKLFLSMLYNPAVCKP